MVRKVGSKPLNVAAPYIPTELSIGDLNVNVVIVCSEASGGVLDRTVNRFRSAIVIDFAQRRVLDLQLNAIADNARASSAAFPHLPMRTNPEIFFKNFH